jgi:hypothetical protein
MTKDVINGIATIAIGLFVLLQSSSYSKGGVSVAENPAVYPRILAGTAIFLGVLLLAKTFIAGRKRKTAIEQEETKVVGADASAGRARTAKTAAALVGFFVMVWLFGFVVASLSFCFAMPLILGTPKKTAAIVSVSLTAAIYIVFFIFFKVPAPHGIFFG